MEKMDAGSKSGLPEAAIANKGEKITGGDRLNLK